MSIWLLVLAIGAPLILCTVLANVLVRKYAPGKRLLTPIQSIVFLWAFDILMLKALLKRRKQNAL